MMMMMMTVGIATWEKINKFSFLFGNWMSDSSDCFYRAFTLMGSNVIEAFEFKRGDTFERSFDWWCTKHEVNPQRVSFFYLNECIDFIDRVDILMDHGDENTDIKVYVDKEDISFVTQRIIESSIRKRKRSSFPEKKEEVVKYVKHRKTCPPK